MKNKLAYLFPLLLFIYSVYSFSQTDPNLVLSSSFTFWDFQQSMWQLGYHNRPTSTLIYVSIIVGLFLIYRLILTQLKNKALGPRQAAIIFLLSIAALLPSYPGLSHDIFNYIFNAKMVVEYRANPHIQVALDFPSDPWIKFMHNVHTPAPYGYGWTAFSVIPYLLGNGYLQGELLIFRLVSIAALLLCLWLITQLQKVSPFELALLAFNPLILIEVVGNIHNDIIMMAAALGGYLLISRGIQQKMWLKVLFGILLFSFSISIKYSSVLLLFAWLAWKISGKLTLPQWSVLSQIAPLITTRSQRFLPWYLTWSLVFLPLIKSELWRNTMIAASFAGITSYAFILYYGNYSPELLLNRSIWLFSVPLIYWFIHTMGTKLSKGPKQKVVTK
jgi:hypothetical protein